MPWKQMQDMRGAVSEARGTPSHERCICV